MVSLAAAVCAAQQASPGAAPGGAPAAQPSESQPKPAGASKETPPAKPAASTKTDDDTTSSSKKRAPYVYTAPASPASLDSSETIFSVLTAMNACGYDQELADSDPLRRTVRDEVAGVVAASESAARARDELCKFYRDHEKADPARNLSQYVSLALFLSEPPSFDLTLREADLPPDASYVLGVTNPLHNFYREAGLHVLWQRHHAAYDGYIAGYQQQIVKMISDVHYYLRFPQTSYLGRRFIIYLDPMGAPRQVNARNYSNDYFVVTAPSPGGLHLQEIRHTYLHYILDPLTLKRGNVMNRLSELLNSVGPAPMDESFKNDITLLVTESLIRAIEARTLKAPLPEREKAVDAAMSEGFILTHYFYEVLGRFEAKDNPVGLKDAYGDWLYDIDIPAEKKRASEVKFASKASTELVRTGGGSRSARPAGDLDLAEHRLAAGETAEAQRLAQKALDDQTDDPAHAMFILARVAAREGRMQDARIYFERTLEIARDPRMMAWTHIYLARLLDLQEEREAAITHYRAALANNPAPETRAAAERGLAAPYQVPADKKAPATKNESAPK